VQLNDIEVRFKRSAGNVPVPAAPVPMQAAPAHTPAAAPPVDIPAADTSSLDEPEETLSVVTVASKKVGIFRRCRYASLHRARA
jgi:hypothetical protein